MSGRRLPNILTLAGAVLLMVAAVQPTQAQMPSPPPTGQDLVWATVAYRTAVMSIMNQSLAYSPRIIELSGMMDKAAQRRERRALQKLMPDPDRFKKWAEALEKQVSLYPASDTNATAGAAEILKEANEIVKVTKEYLKLLDE